MAVVKSVGAQVGGVEAAGARARYARAGRRVVVGRARRRRARARGATLAADGTRSRRPPPLGIRPVCDGRLESGAGSSSPAVDELGRRPCCWAWPSLPRRMDWWMARPRTMQGRASISSWAGRKAAAQSATTRSMGGGGDGKACSSQYWCRKGVVQPQQRVLDQHVAAQQRRDDAEGGLDERRQCLAQVVVGYLELLQQAVSAAEEGGGGGGGQQKEGGQ